MGASVSAVEVREARTRRDFNAFIKFPFSLYARDPYYVPQLVRDMKTHYSAKNPFLRQAEVKFFLAFKNGLPAGRIVSIINPEHNSFHKENAGFFGFFESVNDSHVADALLRTVCDELRKQGMKVMRGPMNFSTNDECGFLIDGFDSPPMLMMSYNPPYYNELMEGCGMAKARDLYAYNYTFTGTPPEKVVRVAALAERKGITARPIDMKNFMADMKSFKDIYNSAWKDNWGFIPLSNEEISYSAARLKPLVVPEFTLIAEKNGEPVGFLGFLPDFNSVLKHMHGKLTPVTLLKALYFSKKITALRVLLYGIKPEYRSRGVEALLLAKGYNNIVQRGGYRNVEFSWILEDNIPVQRIIEMFGASLYKRYRIYEKAL
ncbi:MAG: N-acetyltransferase [Nitrospirae bacterium]|nr:N-acetyltransferase [Nitrospirota bacterium]